MVGHRRDDQIRRPLRRLADKGIEFVQDEVAEIDLDRRLVRTQLNRFSFDYLIIALGTKLAPETVAGFDKMAYDLYDLEGCRRIRAALEAFTGGTIGVFVPSMPFK